MPWHDNGWTGGIFSSPTANSACLVLKRIGQGRDDAKEGAAAEKGFEDFRDWLPPCAEEHAAIMSPTSYARVFNHPYAGFEDAYEDFLDTRFEHRPYSAACIA